MTEVSAWLRAHPQWHANQQLNRWVAAGLHRHSTLWSDLMARAVKIFTDDIALRRRRGQPRRREQPSLGKGSRVPGKAKKQSDLRAAAPVTDRVYKKYAVKKADRSGGSGEGLASEVLRRRRNMAAALGTNFAQDMPNYPGGLERALGLFADMTLEDIKGLENEVTQ
jgi:hypothetical protein